MSKVQEKESTLLNNLSGTEIANELDSRLRDLEKNIAVAREFIKLADESYSELRHKWNLLHEEVRSEPQTQTTERATVTDEKAETRPKKKHHSKTTAKAIIKLDEPESLSSTEMSAKPGSHSKRVKTVNRSKREPGISSEDADSHGSEKPFQPYRDPGRRHGRTGGRN